MAIDTINKLNTTDEGLSNPVDCPVCHVNTAMRLFFAEDRSVIGMLLPEDKDMAIAVCPRCGSVFEVAKNYFRERSAGTFVTMTPDDLTLIKGK